MKVELKSEKPKVIASRLGAFLETEPKVTCDEMILDVPGKFGSGQIKSINFQNGLSLFIVNCILVEDLTLVFRRKAANPLRFIYCQEGEFLLILKNQDIQYKLEKYEGSISAVTSGNEQSIKINSNERVIFFSLDINRETYFHKIECKLDSHPNKLAEALKDIHSKKPFLYVSPYSIAISELMAKMENSKFEGIARISYLESLVLQLFSLQIRQYEHDKNTLNDRVRLRKYDIEKIIMAKNILVEHLKNPPSIKELSLMIGINQNKLKKGFKTFFRTTIYNFIRWKRMEIAKVLLSYGDKLIEDVAEEVGYTNKSHFAKRFKERFGILPKDYIKQIHVDISENQN